MFAAVAKGACPKRGGEALKLHRAAMFGEVSNAGASRQPLAKPVAGKSGTAFAVITSNRVPRPDSAAQASRRGGARNRADRVSHNLTAAQVAGLLAAARHAGNIGLPLNRMTTIHWERAGVPLAGMVRATGRYTDLVTRFLARRRQRTAWLCVHENGPRKGGHCHLLVHVPAGLVKALTGQQRAILKRITGKTYRARVIKSDPVGGKLGIEANAPDLHAVNLARALGYLAKGADSNAAALLGLHRLDGGGPVIGRRCSTSQNIGAKARSERQ
jgi:hypothetical protein